MFFIITDNYQLACRKLRDNNTLEIVWVPGHSDVAGNEEAEQLAREGSSVQPCTPEPVLGITTATTYASVKQLYRRKFELPWKLIPGAETSKRMMKSTSAARAEEVLRLGRKDLRMVSAMLTGHGPFRNHLFKMGVVQNNVCRFCDKEAETHDHILNQCPALEKKRFEMLGVNTTMTCASIKELARFASSIKIN